MMIDIDGIKVNYEVFGEGKDLLVLHGWGASIGAVMPMVNAWKDKFRVWALDLPGFGKSGLPGNDWDVYSYADFVEKFMRTVGLENPILVGHSFGGRLCIILAAKKMTNPEKMILVDAAGVKPKHGINYKIKVYSYKLAKKTANIIGKFSKETEERIKSAFGSDDYKNANPVMRGVMVRVVNEDLTYLFDKVDMPTLLMWGENDDATPVSDARIMESKMRDAGLVVLKNAGHFSYIDNMGEFAVITNNFLKS